MSRELVFQYLSAIGFVFMLSGINFAPDPVPRHLLAYANLALAFRSWQLTQTFRKVLPATGRGAAVRITVLFGFVFVGTLTPLLIGALLLVGNPTAIAARPLHPATAVAALLAGAYAIWIWRADQPHIGGANLPSTRSSASRSARSRTSNSAGGW